MKSRFVVLILTQLAMSTSSVSAQTSAKGQPWEGHWASSHAACEKVTCTGELDCDGTSYSFDDFWFAGVPGFFVCVVAATGSETTGDYNTLQLACAAEGTVYVNAIRLRVVDDKLLYQWADANQDETASPRFLGKEEVLQRCPNQKKPMELFGE